MNQELNEGFGARIETAIRTLEEMIKKIDMALKFIDEKSDEIQANKGFIVKKKERDLFIRLVDAVDDSDYDEIEASMKLYKRYNTHP